MDVTLTTEEFQRIQDFFTFITRPDFGPADAGEMVAQAYEICDEILPVIVEREHFIASPVADDPQE